MDHKGSECNTVSCYECGISCFHMCNLICTIRFYGTLLVLQAILHNITYLVQH